MGAPNLLPRARRSREWSPSACWTAACRAIAESLVSALAREYPGIRLRVLTGYSGHLQEWLDAGVVEIATLYDVTTSTSLHVRRLLDEHLWAVAPTQVWPDPNRPVPFAELARTGWSCRTTAWSSHAHRLGCRDGQSRTAGSRRGEHDACAKTTRRSRNRLDGAATHRGRAGDSRGTLTGAPLTEPALLRSIVLAPRAAPEYRPPSKSSPRHSRAAS